MSRMVAWPSMKRLLAVLACACGAHAAGTDTWKSFTATLAPGASHEECMRLEAGDARKYYWKSSAAVDFNVHYHEGSEATYPVKRDGMRGDGGSLKPKTAQEYCWMWTARDKPVKLEGRIEAK